MGEGLALLLAFLLARRTLTGDSSNSTTLHSAGVAIRREPLKTTAGSPMHPDVLELRAFYASALGSVVRRLLAGRIRARWRSVSGAQLMGLGFAVPYLGAF